MMKNPFRHQHHDAPGGTLEAPRVPDSPAELIEGEGHWKHPRQDVDHDCARDPGSDLRADWELEGAAAEEVLDSDSGRRKPPRAQ
ncbi:hypothetical protein [Actinospica sp.]|jgi:hypothetical protein|uniref:hypothetical protein n=1 Tax=Actinospica sp. TaxID=1872142 RepID=UPI002C823CAD|nr:hypothetical protein [Actinospica sp.]HWG27620.1 hypothetical protein [Actinospica sp.]